MIIIKYEEDSERQPIIDAQIALGFQLIAISNITEGNFLGFDDRLPVQTYSNQQIIDNQMTQLDLTVSIYEAQLGGTV